MAAIREVLDCRSEPSNPEDKYTISVIKNKTITRHLLQKVSRLCLLFAKEIVAKGMESESLGSESPSLALIERHLGFPIDRDVHVDLTVYPNFHCSIYSYIIIFRLIKNFFS